MDLLKRIDAILIEYKYWKKYGVFPEDDYTENTIDASPYILCIQGGKDQTHWTWKKLTEKIFPDRYYKDYKNKIELLTNW
jgi:hypothetical protein